MKYFCMFFMYFYTVYFWRVCVEEGRVGHGFPVWNMLLGYVSHVLLGKLRFCLEGFGGAARTYLFRFINM
jgi:hypothetical protein